MLSARFPFKDQSPTGAKARLQIQKTQFSATNSQNRQPVPSALRSLFASFLSRILNEMSVCSTGVARTIASGRYHTSLSNLQAVKLPKVSAVGTQASGSLKMCHDPA